MVQYRKGTRSRPQVKIPKQYHDDYEDVIQPPSPPPEEDPLIPIEIIKTEPIDVVENDISSFSVESLEAQFAEPPAASPAQGDGFTRIKLTTEHLESSVAAIQIAECHSMNPEEQAEENRMVDEGFRNMMEEVFQGDVGGVLKANVEVGEGGEKMDVERPPDEGGDFVGNHVDAGEGDAWAMSDA